LKLLLEIFRHPEWSTPRSTMGELYVGGKYECFTLELPKEFEGKENVSRKCCIPCGTYPVVLYDSPHNKCTVALLQRVPGRDAIEIHIANEPDEILGCIAVGQIRGRDYVGKSKAAFDLLMAKIKTSIKAGIPVEITISEERTKA